MVHRREGSVIDVGWLLTSTSILRYFSSSSKRRINQEWNIDVSCTVYLIITTNHQTHPSLVWNQKLIYLLRIRHSPIGKEMMKNTTAASRQVEILLYAFTATFPCAFSWSNLAVHTNTYYHRAFNSIALYGYIGNLRMDNLITSCPFMLSVKLKKLCILLITLTHQVGMFIRWLIDHSFLSLSLYYFTVWNNNTYMYWSNIFVYCE